MDKVKTIDEIRLFPEAIGEAGLERDLRIGPEVILSILADKDLKVDEPFHIHYEVNRHLDTIHVEVDVQGTIHITCSRCLSPMVHTVDLHLKSDYIPAGPEMTDHLEAERLSADTGYYRREIQLGEYIISELVLSLPIFYICSTECRGLCPQCGSNLNEGPCRCTHSADTRLQVLSHIKNKLRR